MKATVTIDEIRLKSNLNIIQTLKFTGKFSFHTLLCITQFRSGALRDIKGFIEKIPGTYRSEKPINVTGIDNVHLKCQWIDRSILNGSHQRI